MCEISSARTWSSVDPFHSFLPCPSGVRRTTVLKRIRDPPSVIKASIRFNLGLTERRRSCPSNRQAPGRKCASVSTATLGNPTPHRVVQDHQLYRPRPTKPSTALGSTTCDSSSHAEQSIVFACSSLLAMVWWILLQANRARRCPGLHRAGMASRKPVVILSARIFNSRRYGFTIIVSSHA